MKQLHAPQLGHAARLESILAAQGSALDCSPCGLGKSVTAAEIARRLNCPLFVVAPLSTLPAWRAELDERGVEPLAVINYEKIRGGRTKWVTKDRGQWTWSLPKDTLIVFDEAQVAKNPHSITNKLFVAAKPFQTLLLSGSLAENPAHMRACGYLAGLHDLRSFVTWARQRGCAFDQWNNLVFNDDQRILARLHQEIFPKHGSRMTIEEMAKFMPDNQVLFETVDFGDEGALARLYAEMETELLLLAETAASDSKGAEILTAQLRARQAAELMKTPLLAERAADLAAEGNRVVVFMAFSASLQAFSDRLCGVPLISGLHKDRQATIARFQADQIPILGVNLAAGGVGISLHGRKPRTTLLTVSFNPVEVLQALGRAPRVGGGACIQHVLSAADTIEDKVSASLKEKLRHIELVNSGLTA